MINSCVACGCSNRAIKNDKRAFYKFLLNTSGGLIVLRNLYTYIYIYIYKLFRAIRIYNSYNKNI